MRRVILVGNAVAANLIFGFMKRDCRYEVIAATIDDAYIGTGGVPGLETIPLSLLPTRFPPGRRDRVVMAMGYGDLNRAREAVFLRVKELGYEVETYVHPDAKVYTDELVGDGTLVLPGAVIEPFAKVGRNSVIWSNVTIAHHGTVADHCWVAAGAVISGDASLGRNVFIGVGTTVVNRVSIGDYSIIGAGALIIKSTKPAAVHFAKGTDAIAFDSHAYLRRFGFG